MTRVCCARARASPLSSRRSPLHNEKVSHAHAHAQRRRDVNGRSEIKCTKTMDGNSGRAERRNYDNSGVRADGDWRRQTGSCGRVAAARLAAANTTTTMTTLVVDNCCAGIKRAPNKPSYLWRPTNRHTHRHTRLDNTRARLLAMATHSPLHLCWPKEREREKIASLSLTHTAPDLQMRTRERVSDVCQAHTRLALQFVFIWT